MDSELLTKFGLTKNEAIVYLTLLTLGESKVGSVIKEARFRSGKIYEVLNSLINKGMISYVIKNNIKYYYPQNPKKLLDYIKSEKTELEQEEKEFQGLLPKLDKIYNEKKDPCNVQVYEGIEGIRTALFTLLDKLKNNSEVLTFGSNDSPQRDIILNWAKYDEICKKKNIHSKFIMTVWTKEELERRNKSKNPLKSFRYLAGKDISNFTISEDMVLIFNFNQLNCIFIENIVHSEQFSRLFDLLWKQAKP